MEYQYTEELDRPMYYMHKRNSAAPLKAKRCDFLCIWGKERESLFKDATKLFKRQHLQVLTVKLSYGEILIRKLFPVVVFIPLSVNVYYVLQF